jgi:hypothetical protein
MTTERNRHGLQRDIPEPIKRIVRQECGFGCVVCGASFCDYAHLEPAYEDAEEHAASAIALLSPDCHRQLDGKLWSMQKILAARRNPKCKQDGFSRGSFDLGYAVPTVVFGGATLRNCRVPLMRGQQRLIEVQAPEEPGGPFRLSALFADSSGEVTLRIIENEWRASTDNWDVEFIGPRITIREARGKLCLVLRADPPDGIVIERLRMQWQGATFEGDAEKLILGVGGRTTILRGCSFDGAMVGFAL